MLHIYCLFVVRVCLLPVGRVMGGKCVIRKLIQWPLSSYEHCRIVSSSVEISNGNFQADSSLFIPQLKFAASINVQLHHC